MHWISLCIVLYRVALYSKAEKSYFVEQLSCDLQNNNNNNNRLVECNSCLNFSSRSSLEDSSPNLFPINNVFFKKITNNSLTWFSHNTSESIFKNVTITLFTWNPRLLRGEPVPDCCGVPFNRTSCQIPQCFSEPVYSSVSDGVTRISKQLRFLTMCGSSRPFARYFNICSNRSTVWGEEYNCDCVIYDSATGKLRPGNLTYMKSQAGHDKVWFVEPQATVFEVCLFTMSRVEVMKRGTRMNDEQVMDSVVFQREVFYMKNYSGLDGVVFDILTNISVNCSVSYFQGTMLYNFSSTDLNNTDYDNETFVCMSMWPNGTKEYLPHGTHVKCMPQNSSSEDVSNIYESEMMSSFHSTVVEIFLPIFFAIALVIIISCTVVKLRKKYRKFIKDTNSFSNDMKAAMQNFTLTPFDFSQEEENAEKCDVYDAAEIEWILYVRNQKTNNNKSVDIAIPLDGTFEFQSGMNMHYELKEVSHNQLVHDDNDHAEVTFSGHTATTDSGCPRSLDSASHLISLNSHEKPPFFSLDDVFLMHEESANHESVVHEDCHVLPAQNGYWSKESYGEKIERLSLTSADTGCETDCIANSFASDDDNFETNSIRTSIDDRKRIYCKTVSKDSGVVAESHSILVEK